MTAPTDEIKEEEAKPRLLMIDDSKVMRKSAVKMLGKDFDVIVAEDGKDGWAKILEDDSIQVVFTDLNMPNMNGYELLETIRTNQDDGIRNLPVIVITGAENDDEAKERAFDKGATDFITKPFNSTDLRARAQAHADYQRKTKALQDHSKVDALTQLGNEQHFRERLEQDVSFVSRHKEDLAVLFVELNDFNALFMKIGRAGADSVIKQIAKVLLKAVRKEDTVARLGLARFAVSLPTAKPDGAVELAQRICKVVDSFKAKLRGESITISISIGLYIPAQGTRPSCDEVWDGTKEALTQALAKGRGEVQVIRATPPEDGVFIEPAGGEVVPLITDEAVESISIDEALLQLQRGEQASVKYQLPNIVKQLAPIFKLLNKEQKQNLIEELTQ